MFNFFKKAEPKSPPIFLYVVPFKVKPLDGCSMPKNLKGAVVLCYVPGSDHRTATADAFRKLKEEKYDIVDFAGDIQQIDPGAWNEYVTSIWPEFLSHFPTKEQLESHLKSGTIFFGPFCGWETD